MNIATPLRAVPALFALSLCVCAAARGGVRFQHGDWEVVCDNTLTCRIAGYCAEENYDEGCGSVLITRAAGPNAPLKGEVTLAADFDDYTEDPLVLTLRIGDESKGKLKYQGDYLLTPAQIRALLAAARKDEIVEFVGDTKSFTLSGKGVSAVLLKADAIQGRIGTSGALIRKGNKPEESVSSPVPVPVIQAAAVSKAPPRDLTAPEIAALKPMLLKSVKGECDLLDELEPTKEIDFTLTPLDDRHVLISTGCWLGASDTSSVYWVMDSALKEAPKFVLTHVGWYEEGSIHSPSKGGWDCWSGSSEVWDGQAFRLSEEWTTGMCRRIRPGGAWHLPTYVTHIINEDGTPRAPD
jgi:hypothetical protein